MQREFTDALKVAHQQLTVVNPLIVGVLHRGATSPLDLPGSPFHEPTHSLPQLEAYLQRHQCLCLLTDEPYPCIAPATSPVFMLSHKNL